MVPRVLEHVAFVHGHQRDRLRDVEGCPAAESHDTIRAVRAEFGNAFVHLRACGIAVHAREDLRRRAVQFRDEGAEDRQVLHPAVGHHERPAHAAGREVRGDEVPRAGAEMDLGREGESRDRRGCFHRGALR
jgi:hypothetical protein